MINYIFNINNSLLFIIIIIVIRAIQTGANLKGNGMIFDITTKFSILMYSYQNLNEFFLYKNFDHLNLVIISQWR